MALDERLIVVGHIAGAFGVKGEVRLRSYTADPEAIFDYGPLRDAKGAVLLTPKDARPQGEEFVVQAKEARTREEWEALRGTRLHVNRSALPPPEDEDDFYIEDLIGCRVTFADGKPLGFVQQVHNFGADDLLEIKLGEGQEAMLLPFTHAQVPEVRLGERLLIAEPHPHYLPESMRHTPPSPVDGEAPDSARRHEDDMESG
jgi:16S rRNA processing protein RimM